MRMVAPIGSVAPNRFWRTVAPITATLAAWVTSSSEKLEPAGHGPVADVEILRLGAGEAGEPVLIFENHLRAGAGAGRGLGDGRDFALDGLHVVVDQGLGLAPAHVQAAAGHGAAGDEQQVGAHGGDLVLHLLLRALADADHGDDRADADDDAQHGEHGAHLVARQRPQCDF